MTDRLQSHSVPSENGSPQNCIQKLTEADVLITAALAERPTRPPDLWAENQALHTLAQQLMDDPQSRLKALVQIARDLCRADTVGISLLKPLADGTFAVRWVAIAGALESLEHTTTSVTVNPCGTTIQCGQPQLYARPERYFTYLHHPQVAIVEGLLFPLCVNNQSLGTLWLLSHTENRLFDREDQRLMAGLAGFTVDALQRLCLAVDVTDRKRVEADRKQAEALLRDSEERFHNIADNSPFMVWMTDPTGYCYYLSQSWYDFTGQTPETGLGFGWLNVTHPDDLKAAERSFMTANERQGEVRVEYRLRRHDGEYSWAIDAANPWFSADGEFKGYIGSVIDINDRKQAEVALQRSEERYRMLFESIDEGFCVIEVLFDANDTPIDYRFLEVNPAFENQTGLQQATGKTVRQLVPDLEQHWIETYANLILTGESLRFENRAEAMNRWFDVYAFCIGRPQERKVALLFNDISDRKHVEADRDQTEAALRQSEEQSRNILESITDAFFAVDENWRFTYINQSASVLVDRTPSDLVGKVFWEEFSGVNDSQFEQMHRRVMRDRAAESLTEFYPDHDRWYEVRTYPAVNGVTIYFKNVTERKQIEAEREQLLQREQAAREAAETANRIKDEFLAVLSHELRSPLNPILGWSRLLQGGKLDAAKTAQALATIERNAKLQAELIEDLLDVSRILQGKLSLNVSPVNLAETIRAAIETVHLAADAKSIAVEVSVDPNVRSSSGDATRLQQVVWNLLSNAVKFTPPGGRVEVQLALVNNQAQITVRDTGKGIVSGFLPYVFDYFRQADSATTRKFGGLGLGLAIVRHLVELHGGTVEADSPGEGLGATFTVRLPLMPIATVEQTEPFFQSSLSLHGVRVLVVDDEPDTREFVVFLLQQGGANVISATTAGEALAALAQFQPDILLSDIGMPEADGYSLIRQVRSLSPDQGGQIPAIALTAYAGDFNEKQALAAGFQRHLAKPVEPETLVRAIVTLLKRQS